MTVLECFALSYIPLLSSSLCEYSELLIFGFCCCLFNSSVYVGTTWDLIGSVEINTRVQCFLDYISIGQHCREGGASTTHQVESQRNCLPAVDQNRISEH